MLDQRGVSPIVGTIFMVAVVVVIGVVVWGAVSGFTTDIGEPAPNVAETTGEFVPGGQDDQQIVRIEHIAGDGVDVEEIEIIVRADGADNEDDLPTEATLIDLPAEDDDIDDENIDGDEDLIDTSGGLPFSDFEDKTIIEADSNTWSTTDTIQFRIGVGGADFRDEPLGTNPEADELEVTIVHIPSDAILFEEVFRP